MPGMPRSRRRTPPALGAPLLLGVASCVVGACVVDWDSLDPRLGGGGAGAQGTGAAGLGGQGAAGGGAVCSGSLETCPGDEGPCLTDLLTDAEHCGSCEKSCSGDALPLHTDPACALGECTYTCQDGFGDCDELASNGCEEPLNSPTHCGECDRACNGCTADGLCPPTEIVTNEDMPRRVALSSEHLYFVTSPGGGLPGKLKRWNLASQVLDELTDDLLDPSDLAVDGDRVYVAEQGEVEPSVYRVRRFSLDTGAEELPAIETSQPVIDVATDGTSVFLAEHQTRLLSASPMGGTATPVVVLASSPGGDPVRLGAIAPAGIKIAMTTRETSEFSPDGSVLLAPKAPGEPTAISTSERFPRDVVTSGQLLFWVDAATGGVRRANLDGGGLTSLASGEGELRAIAFASPHVYYTVFAASGAVKRVSTVSGRSGGAPKPVPLATGRLFPNGIAVSDTHVFWAEEGSGKLMRVLR